MKLLNLRATEVNWLVSSRTHICQDLFNKTVQGVVIVLVGFKTSFPGWFIPFLVPLFFHGFLVHSNLNWDFGPLKYIIVSPRFHRFHHTTAQVGFHKNFAGLFSFYDYLFGTAYCPKEFHGGLQYGVRPAFDHNRQVPQEVGASTKVRASGASSI